MGSDLRTRQHLFFDLDDTLWDFEKNSSLVLNDLFHEFDLETKLKTNFHKFNKTYQKTNKRLWGLYNRKEIDKHYLRSHRFNLTFNQFDYDNYSENLRLTELYLERAPRGTALKENCIETLDYLKQNYTLHIITNGFKEVQGIKIDGSGLRKYFSQIIISEEHHLTKPDPALFKLAESLAGTDSASCVMIGDNFECDITGALNAGWDAIYFSKVGLDFFEGKKINDLAQLKSIF